MKKIGILLIVGISFSLFSATYYVDIKNPKAKDTNPGTEELPFKTINGALIHLKPGDTLYIRGGTYREAIILAKNKEEFEKSWFFEWLKKQKWYEKNSVKEVSGKNYGEMISIIGYPGEEVYVKGSEVVSGWEKYKENIWVTDWEYNSQQVFCDGKLLKQIGGELYDKLRMDNWLGRKGEGIKDMHPGSFFYDIKEKKLYIWLSDNSNPNDHLIEASVRPILFYFLGVEFLRMANIKFYHSNTTSSPFYSTSSLSWPTNNVILDNIECSYTDWRGLYVSGYCNTIINSKFNWNGNSGLDGSGWGHRIINCETSYNNYRYFSPWWHGGGMKIIPYAHGIIFTNHISSYNRGIGMWFDEGCSGVIIQNCIIHHNEGNGIFYEISNHGIIRNNVVYENLGTGIVVQDESDNLILHNLVYKNGSGIRVSSIIKTRGWWGETFGREEDNYTWVRNNIVWGNIIMDNGDSSGIKTEMPYDLIMPDPDAPRNYNNLSDYNIFWRSDGKEVKIITGIQRENHFLNKKVYNLKEWQEKTGNDKHSKIIEPKFINLEKRDFRPAPNSPAIGFVKPFITSRYDFDNNIRIPPGEKVKGLTAGPFEFKEVK